MASPVELTVARAGNGPRRALLLHGLGSNAAGWWRLGADLAARGWSVDMPDLRGHGSSPKGDDYSLTAYAADVAALPAPWQLVLGHSLGGAIALLVAGARPGWTELLILEDPALHFTDIDAAEGWLLADFIGDISAEALQGAHPEWAAEDCRAKAAALAACGPDVVRMTLRHNEDWDVRPWLSRVAVPTVVIGADPALGALVDAGDVASAGNDRVAYRMVAGGEHSIHRNAYPGFLAAVLEAGAGEAAR